MRALLVGAEPRMGGGEVVLLDLFRSLPARGDCRVDLLVPRGAAVVRAAASPAPRTGRLLTSSLLVRISGVGLLGWIGAVLLGNLSLCSRVRRDRYDVVLFNGLGPAVFGLLLRLLPATRVVAIHHNLTSSRFETFFGRRLFPGHALVAVSRAVADAVRSPQNRERLRVIPNGVAGTPPPDFGRFARPGPTRIVMAGRITRWKGFHVLIRALGVLRRRDGIGPEVLRVEIAGRPWSREDERYRASLVRAVAEEGLGATVRFLGHVALPPVLAGAHCLVHASIEPEPFGLVVLEGMAHGCVVVASDAGGVREIVTHGETGYLVAPGDADGLADRLADLLARRAAPEMRAMARCAHRTATERFSLGRQADGYLRLFRDLRAGER